MQGEAVRRLLAHRLPGDSSAAAKEEWNDIVEGEHPLWEGIGESYKHTIRAFLVYFHTQLLRHSTERFSFKNGSVGAALCNASLHFTAPYLAFFTPLQKGYSCNEICKRKTCVCPSKALVCTEAVLQKYLSRV